MAELKDRWALVTGAASGIGQAVAQRLAADGAHLLLIDQHDVSARPAGARVQRLDVTDETAVQQLHAALLAEGRSIDILVNCAGIGSIGSMTDLPLADWRRVIDVNLHGTYLMCRAALPGMRRAGRGAIVNIGSTFGLLARENTVAYAVSKAAVIHLTRCMAVDLADAGIRVNCVCPGIVETPMTSPLYRPEQAELLQRNFAAHALRRGAQPSEIAEVVAFLVSDRASFMTGDIVPVDGGYTAGKWLPDAPAGGGSNAGSI